MNKIIKGTVIDVTVDGVGQVRALVERVNRDGLAVVIDGRDAHVPRALIDAGKYTIVNQPYRDDVEEAVAPVKRAKPRMTKEQRREAREKGKREHNG